MAGLAAAAIELGLAGELHMFRRPVVMGGGTPLIEANRVGCAVVGCDINPLYAWIVGEELEHLDHEAYRQAADQLVSHLQKKIGDLYVTDCPAYGDKNVPVKYFLWVKTLPCAECKRDIDLFP